MLLDKKSTFDCGFLIKPGTMTGTGIDDKQSEEHTPNYTLRHSIITKFSFQWIVVIHLICSKAKLLMYRGK